jgi:hypothetical protein
LHIVHAPDPLLQHGKTQLRSRSFTVKLTKKSVRQIEKTALASERKPIIVMVPMHKGSQVHVPELELRAAYSRMPGLYAAKVASLVFGQDFEEAAHQPDGLDLLDPIKLQAVLSMLCPVHKKELALANVCFIFFFCFQYT